MQRFVMVVMLVSSAGLVLGCGDSDDGGSTIRAVCNTTCARALECVPDSTVSQEECSNQCVQASGNLVCDDVNEANLASCLSGLEALSCEQLEAGQAPAVCDRVCLVRVQAGSELGAAELNLLQ